MHMIMHIMSQYVGFKKQTNHQVMMVKYSNKARNPKKKKKTLLHSSMVVVASCSKAEFTITEAKYKQTAKENSNQQDMHVCTQIYIMK